MQFHKKGVRIFISYSAISIATGVCLLLTILFPLCREKNSNPELILTQLKVKHSLTWVLFREPRCAQMINSKFPWFIFGSSRLLSWLWWVCQELTAQRLASRCNNFPDTNCTLRCAGSYRMNRNRWWQNFSNLYLQVIYFLIYFEIINWAIQSLNNELSKNK